MLYYVEPSAGEAWTPWPIGCDNGNALSPNARGGRLKEVFSRCAMIERGTKIRLRIVSLAAQTASERRHVLALAFILLAALAIRVYGNNLSLPYVPHPDEPAVVDRALAMLRTGDYDPHSFIYPTLYTYLQLLVYVVHFLWGESQGLYKSLGELPTSTYTFTTVPGFYLWGRFLTALLGTGTVFVVFRTGARLYGTGAGLAGALLLTFSVLHSAHSHYITVDVPATFFAAVAFAFIAELFVRGESDNRRSNRRTYLLAGLFVGLAIGTKYNAVFIIIPFLLAHLFVTPRRDWLSGSLAAGLGLVAIGFLASSPFALLELPRFLDDVASIIYHYKFAGHVGFEGSNNWLYYLNYFWSSETGPSLLAAAGVLLCFFRHQRRDILLLLFPLLYLAGLSSYRVNFLRNLLPIVPFLCLLGGVFVAEVWGWLSRKSGRLVLSDSVVPAAVAVAMVLLPALTIVDEDRRNAQTDSRILAEQWVQANLYPAVRVVTELHAVQWRNYPMVSTVEALIEHPRGWYLQNGYQYLIASSLKYQDYLSQPDKFPGKARAYQELLHEFEVAAQFPGKENGGLGPEVTILKTGFKENELIIPFRRDVSFGGAIDLIGYDLGKPVYAAQDLQAKPAAVLAPGDTIDLLFYWRAERKLGEDYKVFVHLLDSKGTAVAQRDTPPLSGSYPTSRWRQGELVMDPAPLALPTNLGPGTYRLEVGLYSQSTMKRLRVSGKDHKPDDKVILEPIEVK